MKQRELTHDELTGTYGESPEIIGLHLHKDPDALAMVSNIGLTIRTLCNIQLKNGFPIDLVSKRDRIINNILYDFGDAIHNVRINSLATSEFKVKQCGIHYMIHSINAIDQGHGKTQGEWKTIIPICKTLTNQVFDHNRKLVSKYYNELTALGYCPND